METIVVNFFKSRIIDKLKQQHQLPKPPRGKTV